MGLFSGARAHAICAFARLLAPALGLRLPASTAAAVAPAGRWHALFIEEPRHDAGAAWLENSCWTSTQRARAHTPLTAPGFHDDQLSLLQALLARYLRRSAHQVDVAGSARDGAAAGAHPAPRCIVYDCMELPPSDGAPRQLLQREAALLKQAALVLTAGPSLYEARRQQHAQVVCLPAP